MPGTPPILQFIGVTIEDEAHDYDIDLKGVSLALGAGDLALVMLQRGSFHTPLADAAEGLAEPDAGEVLFAGRNWQRTLATRASRQRFAIGRVFEGHAWVSNLDIDENVLLPSRHHSSRSDAELREEAERLSRHFGLPELPTIRPARATPETLRRAACVRAFLGAPDLLILERPAQSIHAAIRAALLASVAAARQRGAAALWLTSLPEVFDDPDLRPTARYRMDGPALTPADPPR